MNCYSVTFNCSFQGKYGQRVTTKDGKLFAESIGEAINKAETKIGTTVMVPESYDGDLREATLTELTRIQKDGESI